MNLTILRFVLLKSNFIKQQHHNLGSWLDFFASRFKAERKCQAKILQMAGKNSVWNKATPYFKKKLNEFRKDILRKPLFKNKLMRKAIEN